MAQEGDPERPAPTTATAEDGGVDGVGEDGEGAIDEDALVDDGVAEDGAVQEVPVEDSAGTASAGTSRGGRSRGGKARGGKDTAGKVGGKDGGGRLNLRRRRSVAPPDELGGFADGGLAILRPDGTRVHMTPSRVAAALRYFLARVQLHDADGLPPRLALTSALIGEGVTYVTRSIASVVAYDTGASVVVVDLNWRRPTRPTEGDGAADAPPRRLGLASVVEEGVALADVIEPTTNPRLSLVPAGEVAVARRPALAGGEALGRVLDELESQFEFVLLDLPPVLATSEAMNLAQLADAYVLVVRQGATSEAQVEAALEEMQGAEALGVILNRFESRIPKRLRRLVGT
jgi:Mrp family chromosome partitioning ATPase